MAFADWIALSEIFLVVSYQNQKQNQVFPGTRLWENMALIGHSSMKDGKCENIFKKYPSIDQCALWVVGWPCIRYNMKKG